MELEIVEESNSTKIIIKNNIKSVADNNLIKSAIETIQNKDTSKFIEIYIKDSFIITSSVIGFLLKCIKKDGMSIVIFVSNIELYNMMEDMSLINILNVKKDRL